jgi:hypothetical protein
VLPFRKVNAPYWGIVAKVTDGEGSGAETHIAILKAKLNGGFQVQFEYGSFSIPEASGLVVFDSTRNTFFELGQYESAQTLTLPLTYEIA